MIEATADQVCAYKPSLGFYQAMESAGLELLTEVRELLPPDLPLIIDSKHGGTEQCLRDGELRVSIGIRLCSGLLTASLG